MMSIPLSLTQQFFIIYSLGIASEVAPGCLFLLASFFVLFCFSVVFCLGFLFRFKSGRYSDMWMQNYFKLLLRLRRFGPGFCLSKI